MPISPTRPLSVNVAGEVNAVRYVATANATLSFICVSSSGKLHLFTTDQMGAGLRIASSVNLGDIALIDVEVVPLEDGRFRAVAVGIAEAIYFVTIDLAAQSLIVTAVVTSKSNDNRCVGRYLDDRHVVIGGQVGQTCVVDAIDCYVVDEVQLPHSSTPRAIGQFGECMVSTGQDRQIALWRFRIESTGVEVETCAVVSDAHSGWIWQVAPHPTDGSLISVSSDTRVGRYLPSSQRVSYVAELPGAWLMCVLGLPDISGGPIVLVGSGNGTLTSLDGDTFEPIVTVVAHSDEINDLATDETGRVVASVSRDGSIVAFPAGYFPAESTNRSTAVSKWGADAPTSIDLLGRNRIAEFLRSKVTDFLEGTQGPGSRAFLISGPWGAGKSSLVQLLLDGTRASPPFPIVAEVNAWSTMGRGISWTEAIEALTAEYIRAAREQSILTWLRLRVQLLVQLSSVALSTVLIFVTLLGVAIIVGGLVTPSLDAQSWTAIGTVLAGVVPIAAAVAASSTLRKFRSADGFKESRWETHEARDTVLIAARIVSLCLRVVDRPFIIIIDDLDRCNPEAVTETLESLHCVLESPALNFKKNGVVIVAADEMWLRGSFQKIYGEMTVQDFGVGSSVGSRFLEKMFFLVLPTGRISPEGENDFLDSLVAKPANPSHEPSNPHIIYGFRELLPDNPRTVQRVVVAFEGLRELKAAEGLPVSSATLMLWCILRTRWPDGALALAADPEAIAETSGSSDALIDWLNRPEVRRVLTWPVGGPLLPVDIERCSSDV
ncbi:P-loop NTPase fold protein [Candidatus Microthrix parvicella]|uniref:KAP NTPase domain-containing protein n=1 Tax=Candidatus Neomicrothrix parvicella RN1 TaxID=1229780 RepID=R4Z7Q0_9ACTN|nr:P-loop NTPase fold protein [Candidatus Microthrix parvicella]CCM65892.1 hypothetical protein BN381_80422 [Candidatus Microthrix parvicella RN1]